VRNALDRIPAEIEWVAVHDAARPLISQGLIDRTLAAAVAHGGAVAAMPVALTVRQASGPLPAKSEGVIPRDRLWAMQTPQIMRRADLARAFERCTVPLEQITDDVQLLELMGLDVWLVPGEEANLKVTTPTDLIIAQTLWEGRSR
jgi:2-C-methyl-D-erythritol 4-phosphate cytidylyltransferase